MRTTVTVALPNQPAEEARQARLEGFWQQLASSSQASPPLQQIGNRLYELTFDQMDPMARLAHEHRKAARTLQDTTALLMREMWFNYVDVLEREQPKPLSLSFHIDGPTLMVWAMVADDDRETRLSFFGIGARARAPFAEFGLDVDTMVVHPRNNYDVPDDYKTLPNELWLQHG